ncbi:MAG: hypothetical protein J7L82_04840 [Staphylothermus sp.]|nr:hypothetical protein [Staphylothermus sp.]
MVPRLKILEEENVDIIVGLPNTEQVRESFAIQLFQFINNLAIKTGRKRFTLHIVSIKPRPMYIEDLRFLLQHNIAYTLVLRYYRHDLEKINELVKALKRESSYVYGFVFHDFKELSDLLRSHGVEVEEVEQR